MWGGRGPGRLTWLVVQRGLNVGVSKADNSRLLELGNSTSRAGQTESGIEGLSGGLGRVHVEENQAESTRYTPEK